MPQTTPPPRSATQQLTEANKVLTAWQKVLDQKLRAMNTAQESYVAKKTTTQVVWEEVVEVPVVSQPYQYSQGLYAAAGSSGQSGESSSQVYGPERVWKSFGIGDMAQSQKTQWNLIHSL